MKTITELEIELQDARNRRNKIRRHIKNVNDYYERQIYKQSYRVVKKTIKRLKLKIQNLRNKENV